MRMSLRRRASATALATVCVLSLPSAAQATGITEFPDNGSEQGGRGGAWVARASDPLAAFYNPAGLAGQPTRLVLQANLNFQVTCMNRLKAMNDPTSDGIAPGQYYPQVCSKDGAAPDPQVAMTYHLTDRVGLGIAPILAPSGGASNVSFPEFVQATAGGRTSYIPGPTRYLLTGANLVVLNPTVGVGVEVARGLRLGASFQWGIASLSFTNAVAATANTGGPGMTYLPGAGDVQAVSTVKNYFVPGFTLGAIYSPTSDFDIAGWYKYASPINATGDTIATTAFYTAPVAEGKSAGGAVSNTALPNCGNPMNTGANATLCGNGDNLHLRISQPMEAKVGFRYHMKRRDVPYDEHVRDPMSQDIFDVEVDLTWANDSSFDYLQARFPAVANGSGAGLLTLNGLPAVAPPNSDVPHMFKDVYGVRLGGDINVLPDQLTVRGGGFFQSDGQNPQYQNVDFMGSMNVGLALGGTYRIHLSKEKASALELSIGYEHVFYWNETNTNVSGGPGSGLSATAGTSCYNNAVVNSTGTTCPASSTSNTTTSYRTAWPVNLGTISSFINVFNVGLGYKF